MKEGGPKRTWKKRVEEETKKLSCAEKMYFADQYEALVSIR